MSNSPEVHRRARAAYPVVAGLASLLGCDSSHDVPGEANPETTSSLAWLDAAPRVPEGRPIPESVRVDFEGDSTTACGPGTGRLEDGTCRVLATADARYVQRVLIPSGRFVMGRVPMVYDATLSRTNRVPRWPNQPPRFADVDAFWIDLVEVTREAYAECVTEGACTEARCLDGGDGRRDPSSELRGLPQTCVTHTQATSFCAHRGGRLATATEWEYAARGPDSRVFPWGNQIRDELTDAIMPVSIRVDSSYFGVLGLGSNANEWVSDRFAHDVGLSAFAEAFRDSQGPVARARREWERSLACGNADDGCTVEDEDTLRFGIKGPAVVGLRGGRARAPRDHVPDTTLEGWKEIAQHPQLGFRCAADVTADDPRYAVPELPPQIPWIVRTDGGVEIFGGIAEAVSRSEAKAFCAALHLPREAAGSWRLPDGAEVDASRNFFRGPGPFWTADGALHQAPGTDVWSPFDTADQGDEAALLARCVRVGPAAPASPSNAAPTP